MCPFLFFHRLAALNCWTSVLVEARSAIWPHSSQHRAMVQFSSRWL